MTKRRQMWVDSDFQEALRLRASQDGLSCAEDALEIVLRAWLVTQPALGTYLKERARLREEADTTARKLAGLK